MNESTESKKVLKHHWDMEAQCLHLYDPLCCTDPAENLNSIFAEHYGHSLGPHVTIKIELSSVDQFDTSGIAFLVMFRHRLMDSGTNLMLVGASPKLLGVIELLGLSSEFGIVKPVPVEVKR